MLCKRFKYKRIERLVKIEKGKYTGRTRMIQERHQSSFTLSLTEVSVNKQGESWEVQVTG